MSIFQYRFSQQDKLLIGVSTIAFALFIYHSYTIIARHLDHDILEVHKVIKNQSLTMPIVEMRLDSYRHPKSSRPFNEMTFKASLNQQPVPGWAYVNYSIRTDFWWEDDITLNVVGAKNIAEGQSKWPLRIEYATDDKNFGYLIEGHLNGTSFVKAKTEDDFDMIMVKIYSFDTDPCNYPRTNGVPDYFELLPSDELRITVSLKKYNLLNRPDSPCRTDYPSELKKLLKNPLEPTDLYNSILAPNLPYDEDICAALCYDNYWLSQCNCYMHYDILKYSGKPKTDLCLLEHENKDPNCTISLFNPNTPLEALAGCNCWKKCEGYAFEVTGYDKTQIDFG